MATNIRVLLAGAIQFNRKNFDIQISGPTMQIGKAVSKAGPNPSRRITKKLDLFAVIK
jgi:hypothetical protein